MIVIYIQCYTTFVDNPIHSLYDRAIKEITTR